MSKNIKKYSEEEYWKQNFIDRNIVANSNDLQLNIARTKNGKVVNSEEWKKTIDYIINLLNINSKSVILELCCGNGVIIGELSKFAKKAVGVDYSPILLDQLKSNYNSKNIEVVCQDVKAIDLPTSEYDQIIIYFSIQHFSERDSFLLIEKCINSLKSNGKILIGDIPDEDKKWTYINKPEHHIDYFKRLKEVRPKIGNWFKKEFFYAMNDYFHNTRFEILEQPNYQINSDHCFDIIISKK